ncbi:MAG: serine protease [Pseudomonadota bacterium]
MLYLTAVSGETVEEEVSETTTIAAQVSVEPGSQFYDEVLQIRVVSPMAGSKSAIGSGFQVSDDGLVITNYHVVSGFIQSPESNTIEYMSDSGESGELALLNFDVINDLAVLKADLPRGKTFSLAERPLVKGELVYALGNPYDIGIKQVSGPNNGLVDHSFVEKIFFSGSLNPGMSGGPAINRTGDVVGVNVATAGNQISFLVPVNAVSDLLAQDRVVAADDYYAEITRQIDEWQEKRVRTLIDDPWPTKEFVGREFPDEIREDFQCWGHTNEEATDPVVTSVAKTCESKDVVYLGSWLTAGHFHMSYRYEKSERLNALQFANRSSTQMWANNKTSYKDSTNYSCHVDFVDVAESTDALTRITTCIRAYRHFPALYDSLLLVEQLNDDTSWSSHMSVSAMNKEHINALNTKFTEALQ